MKEPVNEEFQRDERGIMTDPEEMLWVIHELSLALGSLAENPGVMMVVGPEVVQGHLMMALGAHELSCDKHKEEQPQEQEKPAEPETIPAFKLGDAINKLLKDL